MIVASRVPLLLLLAVLSAGCAPPRVHPAIAAPVLRGGLDAESSAQLDSLVKDVCSKTVVMLGICGHS